MSRYVILEHDHPGLHWDFMLEVGDVLRTWKLAAPPENGRVVRADASFDHRLRYLDYEGPISGGRGSVTRWDAGSFEWEIDDTNQQKRTKNQIVVRLSGKRLNGVFVLEEQAEGPWTATFWEEKTTTTKQKS